MSNFRAGIDSSWRVGDAPRPSRRCTCLQPLDLEDADGDVSCMKCGRPAAVRLSALMGRTRTSRPIGVIRLIGSVGQAARPARPPRRRPPSAHNGNGSRRLTLREIGELIEKVPNVDWSSVIAAAAVEERARARAR